MKGAGTLCPGGSGVPQFRTSGVEPTLPRCWQRAVPPDWLLVLAPYRGSFPLLRLGFILSARREEGWGGEELGENFLKKKKSGEVHLALQANDLRKGNVYFVP